VIAALVCAAAALLAWPPRHAVGRLRRGGSLRPGAGWPRSPSPLGAALAATVVAGVLSTPLVAGLGGGCAWLATRAWCARRRDGAAEARLLALAGGLGALTAELGAGRGPATAAEAAAAGCGDPDTGRALAAALRGEPPDGGSAATGPVGAALARIRGAARLSERTGCSLAAVAAALADDLRARHRTGLELRAAAAGPRASAAVLTGLPLVGLAMGGGIGADPWAVLTTTGTGQVLLTAGVALEVAGTVWVGRLQQRAMPAGEPGDDRGR
jgi:tight adherence protein B